jgi:transposase-like protein
MSEENFSHLACPNPECQAYGQRGQNNLRPHGWSTADKRVRCLRCTTCGQHFSERANTPLFGLRTTEETLINIARHLVEGTGCRATARLTGVGLNTVLRFTKRFGKHAELFHDGFVRHVHPKQIQPDEAWSFVGKKRQAVR